MKEEERPGVFEDPDHLPGLTLHQPYGGAVLLSAQGYRGKGIESRKVKFTRIGAKIVILIGRERWADHLARLHTDLVRSGRVPDSAFDAAMSLSGVAVAVATVIECRPLQSSDYHSCLWWDASENAKKPRWAWVLGDMRPLKPFPWSGCQGWSRVPRALVEAALVGTREVGRG